MDKTGLDNITIGVSGGIDSAVNLAIIAMILPSDKIHAYYLPSKHSKSIEYVKELCYNNAVEFHIHSIDEAVHQAIKEHDRIYGPKSLDNISYQNIQARER